jgi:hypothetical protein
MIETLRALFGSANKAAIAAGVSRQRLNYWAANGFELSGAGIVYNSRGVQVGAIPTAPAAVALAADRLQWVGPEFPTNPAQVLGADLAKFLPTVINGRQLADAAPAGEWLKWLS